MSEKYTAVNGFIVVDEDWGCAFEQLSASPEFPEIKLCHVSVSDVRKMAGKLSQQVLDTSWMTGLDYGAQQAYEYTVNETAGMLSQVFKQANPDDPVSAEFGEMMVSMGAGRGLNQIYNHIQLPISELWKFQIKGNEGFDFHTVCPSELLNFGEAKYSGSKNPHGLAMSQIKDFLDQEKYIRDYIHLLHIAPEGNSVDNLTQRVFGVVAAFSINSDNYASILENALKTAVGLFNDSQASAVYVVGVSCEDN
ncbi:hypothetical protein [Halopseudomonas maritima]|uniref:hypothetical protein n=1 Tax=Halopseudomonas maritima TaxID=2918528 RepID=UPI001EEAA41F|nr:hypothetical protein [Halopseudomonas maritima]UJJ30497.1 hypothetical protein HV822_11985 [Halopseudomonas maritima]